MTAMAPKTRTYRHAPALATAGEGKDSRATRVVFEGSDAVEKVAKLLGAGSIVSTTAASNELRDLARAVERSGGTLMARLEERVRSLGERHDDPLAEMRHLEARDPDVFLAGALAGFALGRAGWPTDLDTARKDSGRHTRTSKDRDGREGAGVERGPVSSAQTGSGGLGSLEAPPPAPELTAGATPSCAKLKRTLR